MSDERKAEAGFAGAPGYAAPDYEDDDCNYDGPECGLCGDDGWIMLSDAGSGEWGEDCFCDVDRPIECPECRDRRRYEAAMAKRHNDGTQRPGDAEATNATGATPPGSLE